MCYSLTLWRKGSCHLQSCFESCKTLSGLGESILLMMSVRISEMVGYLVKRDTVATEKIGNAEVLQKLHPVDLTSVL